MLGAKEGLALANGTSFSAADVLRAGGKASALLQNCSGKHAAMLATSVANGWDADGYLEFDHPVQKLIDAYIAEAAGGVRHTGIDGCGAPTAMVTLTGLATAVRSLAVSRSAVYLAMCQHPDLVAGTGREDTLVMRAVPGLVAKGGAEGVHVAAHPDGRAVAVKVADGSERAQCRCCWRSCGRWGSTSTMCRSRRSSDTAAPSARFAPWWVSSSAGPRQSGRTSEGDAVGTTAHPLGSRLVQSSRPSAVRRRPGRRRDRG